MCVANVGTQTLRWGFAGNSARLIFKIYHKELIQETLQISVGMFTDFFSL